MALARRIKRLAAGLLAGADIVIGVNDHLVGTGYQSLRYIAGNRGAASRVFSDRLPVDPNPRPPVTRADMQQHPFAGPVGRHFKIPPVPYVPHEMLPVQAG